MLIQPGTTCISNKYGTGTVVDVFDYTVPYMYYPVLVEFQDEKANAIYIEFDFKGHHIKSEKKDAVFIK